MDLTWVNGNNGPTEREGAVMVDEDIGSYVVVSVQDARAPDAIRGHLGWGRLVRADCVLMHGPPRWRRRDLDLEVLLASQASSDGLRVERIKITSMQIRGIDNRPELQFTRVDLAQASSMAEESALVDAIFDSPGSNEEHLRTVLDVLMRNPASDWTGGIEDLLEPVVRHEERVRCSLLESRTVNDQWVSNPPQKSLFRLVLGL